MRYVEYGAGVSTVSLRTHRILALGDEDLPAARQSGSSLRILRDWALPWPPLAFILPTGVPSATKRCRSEAGGMCCVSGRVRCTNGQGQAPHMGANGTNMAF